MAVPYDSALLKAHVPGGTQAYINRALGTITASDLDPQSSSKAAMINGQRSNDVFGKTYCPCAFDTSSPGAARTVNRRTGSSYPDGSSWTPYVNAKGISETGTQFSSSDDAHCIILDYPNNRIMTLRQYYGGGGSEMDCYSAGVSPYNGVESLWMVSPFTGTAPGSGANGSPGTGCGLNIAHGSLWPEDIELFAANGTVRHGLRFTLKPANVSTGTVFPAYKTDGTATPSSSTMKQGQYAFLDCTNAQIYGTSLTTGIYVPGNATATVAARGIAEMMRQFGLRLEDRSGGGFHMSHIRPESWTLNGAANPWLTVLGGYSQPSALMKVVVGFPWSTLKVLKDTFVPSDVTTPPPDPDPTPDPDPVPPPSAPTTAPQTPQALVASAVEAVTTVVATLQADTTRTRTRIQRRLIARTDTSPTSGSVTNIYDSTASQAWGNTVLTGTMTARRPNVDEWVGIAVDLGAAGDLQSGMSLWVYADGLGGGTGTGRMRGVIYRINSSTNKPDGQGWALNASEVTVAAGSAVQPYLLYNNLDITLLADDGGKWAIGAQFGGSSNVIRVPRSDDGIGEFYIDTGWTYGTPPVLCPTTSAGSKRSAFWITAGTPGGGAGGGTITDGETGLSAGSYHYTAYAENSAGSALRDATPYPVTVTGVSVPTPNVPPYPVIAYTIDAYVAGQNGRTVRFTDQSVDTDGTIAVREWDYEGNGTWVVVDSTSTTHFYAPGTYSPKLRITDNDDAVSTSAGDTTITVTAEAPPGTGGVPIVIRDGGRNAAPAEARPVP